MFLAIFSTTFSQHLADAVRRCGDDSDNVLCAKTGNYCRTHAAVLVATVQVFLD